MIKHLIKSIINENIALTVCATICLVLSSFVILYEISFAYKLTAYNFDTTYFIETNEMLFSEAKIKAENVGTKNFSRILFFSGNGIVFGNANSDVIKGRKPLKEGEVIASYVLKIDVGAIIHFGENEYKVVGIANVDDYEILIDYNLNDCSNFAVSGIAFVADVKATRAEIIKELHSEFPESDITTPKKIGVKEAFETTPIFMLTIVIIILSVCTYVLSINYLLRKTYKPMKIYMFLGFDANKIIIRLLSFVLVVISFCFAICGGIFAIAEQIVAKAGSVFMSNVVLSFSDYLLAYAVMILTSVTLLIPAMIDVTKKSVEYKYV